MVSLPLKWESISTTEFKSIESPTMVNSLFWNTNFHNGMNILPNNGPGTLLTRKNVTPLSKSANNNVFKGEKIKYWILNTGKSHKKRPSMIAYFKTNEKLFNGVKAYSAKAFDFSNVTS